MTFAEKWDGGTKIPPICGPSVLIVYRYRGPRLRVKKSPKIVDVVYGRSLTARLARFLYQDECNYLALPVFFFLSFFGRFPPGPLPHPAIIFAFKRGQTGNVPIFQFTHYYRQLCSFKICTCVFTQLQTKLF